MSQTPDRRAPARMIDDQVETLFEHEEEWSELRAADSKSDPEVTDTEGSSVDDQMEGSFVEGSTKSNQSDSYASYQVGQITRDAQERVSQGDETFQPVQSLHRR